MSFEGKDELLVQCLDQKPADLSVCHVSAPSQGRSSVLVLATVVWVLYSEVFS